MKYYSNKAHNTIIENSQQSIKEANAHLIFDTVRKKPGISRAELSKKLCLSQSTVSVLTDELIRRNLILQADTEGTGTSGRKPLSLMVNRDGVQIPSFSFRSKGLLFILYDLELNPIEEHFQAYDEDMLRSGHTADRTKRLVIAPTRIAALFENLFQRARKLSWEKVACVTLSFPGSIQKSTYDSSPLGWTFRDSFIDLLKEKHNDVAVFAGDDTLFCAMSERIANARDDQNAIYVYTGYGVGAATVLDGQFFTKGVTPPNEIGHMTVDYRGRKCSCGNRGCLERYLSTEEILHTVADRIREGNDSCVLALCDYDLDKMSMSMLREALESGDSLVTEVLDDIAVKLLAGLSNMYCAFGTMKTYLGGDITELGETFLKMLKKSTGRIGYGMYFRLPDISYAKTPRNGECLGSAAEYLENYFVFTR